MALIIPLGVFFVISTIVMSLYYILTAESPIERRLRAIGPGAGEAGATAVRTESTSILQRFLAALGQYGFSRGDRSLTQTLSAAGIRSSTATAVFVGTRTLLSVGPALMLLVPQVSRGEPITSTLWLSGLVWFGSHMFINFWLRRRAQRRVRLVTGGLPDALDLMVVCLESGLGLNATIARVGEERSHLHDPLGEEFAQVSLELRNGRRREDSLRALGDRNGVEDLKALAGLVIQSDRLGASMAKTLRAHADLLRTKRRQRAEEAARKLPIKVLFPLAVFLLPPLFIMVAGPAFIKLNEFAKSFLQG